MEEAEYLCDRLAILNRGQILASGALAEIRQAINRRKVYSLGLESVPDGLLPLLGQIEGVINVQPILPVDQAASYFRIETQNNGHEVIPDLVNTVVQAGGRVVACAPVEEPLGEVLARVLKGEKKA
jgi:ABC-2 type transport system ATP-binding protein